MEFRPLETTRSIDKLTGAGQVFSVVAKTISTVGMQADRYNRAAGDIVK